jgi:hypothetical protein
MLLVLTFSEDATFDDLIPHLNGLPFFRLNIDLWKYYKWQVTNDDYYLENKVGLTCREEQVKAVYLRKLIFNPVYIDVPAGGSEESWQREQLIQIIYGIRDLAASQGRLALVHPSRYCSKIHQMRLAKNWFPVPDWSVFHGVPPSVTGSSVVVKTFAPVPVGQGAHVTVKEAPVERLSQEYAWFVQKNMLRASHDVTSVYVNGQIFSYELDRSCLEGVDCRLENHPWSACKISKDEGNGIHSMMKSLNLSFGRFDFLRIDGRLWFLEINPNGQWGWLDPHGTNGLYRAVANEIIRVYEQPQ